MTLIYTIHDIFVIFGWHIYQTSISINELQRDNLVCSKLINSLWNILTITYKIKTACHVQDKLFFLLIKQYNLRTSCFPLDWYMICEMIKKKLPRLPPFETF